MTMTDQPVVQDASFLSWKADPCDYLNDDCMKHILSFVGGKRKSRNKMKATPGSEPYFGLKEAAKLCLALGPVSHTWKNVAEQSAAGLLSNPLNVNLDEFSDDDEAAMQKWVSWLCEIKPRIGRVHSRHHFPNFTSLVQQLTELFQHCDTSQLTHVGLSLALSEETIQQQHDLQDAIAQECPNLQKLSIHIAATDEQSASGIIPPGFLSPSLVSLPSITKLNLCLIVPKLYVSNQDGLALNQLLKDLPGIQPMEESVQRILAKQHLKELSYKPVQGESTRKLCLGIVASEKVGIV